MFVKKSRYDSMERRAEYAEARLRQTIREHNALVEKWNALVRRVNELGGESFLRGKHQESATLAAEDLQRLIQLCHPDKHNGKLMATEMTAKLLKMREILA
jgi:hypothetical protein